MTDNLSSDKINERMKDIYEKMNHLNKLLTIKRSEEPLEESTETMVSDLEKQPWGFITAISSSLKRLISLSSKIVLYFLPTFVSAFSSSVSKL